MGNLGGAAVVSPGSPGGGVGFADVVREILDAGAGSGHHFLEKSEHCFLSEKRREKKNNERDVREWTGFSDLELATAQGGS